MKVFVTGATGFLGSSIVRRLLTQKIHVRAIKRPTSSLDLLGDLAHQIEWIDGGIGNIDALTQGIDGTQGVFHCAAYLGFTDKSSATKLHAVNVEGTAHVVNACLDQPEIKLLHVSSIAALGRSEQAKGEMNESTEWKNSRLNTPYAISKHRAEMEVYRGIAEGLDAVIVNPSLVMGPGRKGENTMQIAERLASGTIPFIPSGSTNVVDVEDVAQGAISAFHNGKSGERYILSGHNLSWAEIFSELAIALQVPPPTRLIHPQLLYSFAAISEAMAKITGVPAKISRATARLSTSVSFYSHEKARRELNYIARPFKETALRIANVLRTPA